MLATALSTVVIWGLLLVSLESCSWAPDGHPPLESVAYHGLPEGKSLVLGRFRVIYKYRESPFRPWKMISHDWNQSAWVATMAVAYAGNRDVFRLGVIGVADSDRVDRAPRGDGTFLWALDPGSYRIQNYLRAIGVMVNEGQLPGGGPSFDVPPDTLVYIGTLTLFLPEETAFDRVFPFDQGSLYIEDDRDGAQKRLADLAPDLRMDPVTRLMRGYPVIPADSLLGPDGDTFLRKKKGPGIR